MGERGSVRLLKIKIHPLFFLALFLYALFGGITEYLVAFLAVTLHELSHYAVARLVGAEELSVTLMPYGATMRAAGELPHLGAVLVAGPLANLVLASFTLSACWLLPELYGALKGFAAANLFLATLNLLPAYPLDGGRLFRLLFKGGWAKVFTSASTCAVGGAALCLFCLRGGLAMLFFALFMLSYFFACCLPRATLAKGDDPLYSLARTDEEGRLLPAVVRIGRSRRRLSPGEITRLCLTYPRETEIKDALSGKAAIGI